MFPVLTEPWLLVVHGTVHRYLVGLLGGAGLGSRWKVDKGMGRLCDGLLGITAPVLSTGTEGAGEGSDSDGEGKANWEDHPAKDQGNEPPATLYQSVLSSLGDVHCPALFLALRIDSNRFILCRIDSNRNDSDSISGRIANRIGMNQNATSSVEHPPMTNVQTHTDFVARAHSSVGTSAA